MGLIHFFGPLLPIIFKDCSFPLFPFFIYLPYFKVWSFIAATLQIWEEGFYALSLLFCVSINLRSLSFTTLLSS
jgi:hypothetical protein